MDDLEYPQIQARLSTPAAAIPGQVGRRAFLGGAIAAGGAIALLPSWMGDMAAAATPIGPEDGVLVLLQLGGGNDGLSTVAPMPGHADHSRYQSFRGNLAVSGALPLADGLGFNPGLTKLKSRWDAGKVAVVRGVGQTANDLSHFTSTATWMAGTSDSARDSGWMGRWLDGVPESAAGLRGVTIGAVGAAPHAGPDLHGHRARDRRRPDRRRPQRAVDEAGVRRGHRDGRGHHGTGAVERPDRRHRRIGHRAARSSSPRSSAPTCPTGRSCRPSPWPPG